MQGAAYAGLRWAVLYLRRPFPKVLSSKAILLVRVTILACDRV